MIDYAKLGDTILQILETVRDNRKEFAADAKRRGITLEQLTAAAIAGMVEELIEGKPPNKQRSAKGNQGTRFRQNKAAGTRGTCIGQLRRPRKLASETVPYPCSGPLGNGS